MIFSFKSPDGVRMTQSRDPHFGDIDVKVFGRSTKIMFGLKTLRGEVTGTQDQWLRTSKARLVIHRHLASCHKPADDLRLFPDRTWSNQPLPRPLLTRSQECDRVSSTTVERVESFQVPCLGLYQVSVRFQRRISVPQRFRNFNK